MINNAGYIVFVLIAFICFIYEQFIKKTPENDKLSDKQKEILKKTLNDYDVY